MAPHIRSGELQLVLGGERLLAAEIHAVWPQTRHLPSKTRAAIDALVQQVPAILADAQGAKAELERPEAPKNNVSAVTSWRSRCVPNFAGHCEGGQDPGDLVLTCRNTGLDENDDTASQILADLQQRIRYNRPSPGTEASLRRPTLRHAGERRPPGSLRKSRSPA
jgi:hypothetical protein